MRILNSKPYTLNQDQYEGNSSELRYHAANATYICLMTLHNLGVLGPGRSEFRGLGFGCFGSSVQGSVRV